RRSRHQHDFHAPLSVCRAGAFLASPARASVWGAAHPAQLRGSGLPTLGKGGMTLAPGRPTKVPKVSRPAEAEIKSAEAKLADLRRMRAIALSLLVLMAGIFVATSLAKARWPWLAYLRAFAEAGMIGACADWFAVVALFRRPFGLPIPHTGIVPNNKDRIGI